MGGNLCDDSTQTRLSQYQSEAVYLLDADTDQTLVDPLLGPINPVGDPTPYYPLLEGSPAIEK